MCKYNVGIVGATGVVGRELLLLIEERNFPLKNLKLFASEKSIGKSIDFRERLYPIEVINRKSLAHCDFVFGCASNEIGKKTAEILKDFSSIFIDNSSAFRYEQNIPLVIPEINGHKIESGTRIIANPNCTAIILAVALWPIHKSFGIERVIVSTYQAVSGAGQEAMQELENQVVQYSKNEPLSINVFPEQILFNVQSHNSAVGENGFNGEEQKVIIEVKKIFSYPDLKISATCIRVPVLRAHVESVNIEVKEKCSVEEILDVLKNTSGVKIINDPANNDFPSSLKASYQNLVLVGRVRKDLSSSDCGFHLLIAGDQLRKGAALNALQIAENIIGLKSEVKVQGCLS
ncbi:MAG: aspartate-semialdehyde dehydrogenase [bacterium]|nr:aspartate-semialdehyde dehydrogenase [bacterium]